MAYVLLWLEKEFIHTVHITDSTYLHVQYHCIKLVCIYRKLSISLNEVFKSVCFIFNLMYICNQHLFWRWYVEHLVKREDKC